MLDCWNQKLGEITIENKPMVQVSPSGTVRHPVFREYFLRKQEEEKNKPQALICIARRLVNIVYGMLKNHTEYREPERKTEKETV